jgi:hypothetical protein
VEWFKKGSGTEGRSAIADLSTPIDNKDKILNFKFFRKETAYFHIILPQLFHEGKFVQGQLTLQRIHLG